MKYTVKISGKTIKTEKVVRSQKNLIKNHENRKKIILNQKKNEKYSFDALECLNFL